MQQHPIENLTLHDGQICLTSAFTTPFRKYMTTPEIMVTKKLSMRELGGNQCQYHFGLNSTTDQVWNLLFKENLSELPVYFDGDRVILQCIPANLEGLYSKTKHALARTNAMYAREREELIPKVIARDNERSSAATEEQSRQGVLQRHFDDFKL